MSIRATDYRPHTGEPLAANEEFLAGGTDLVTLIRSGIHAPAALVDLKRGDLASDITAVDGGWRLGAGTTLVMIEDHHGLAADATALIEAVSAAATRQIRNRATIAGNLLQRSRCDYYRDEAVMCWLKGGDDCPARRGLHEHLAVVDHGPCITTQPSDAASALVALGATITYDVGDDSTTIPVDELLAAPTDDDRRLHRLPHGAVVRHIDVPRAAGGSTYVKAMDRAAWQFALVGVAAVRTDTGATVVASGIAPTPHQLTAVTDALGDDWSPEAITRAAQRASDGLTPGPRNRYKLPLLRGLVQHALHGLA